MDSICFTFVRSVSVAPGEIFGFSPSFGPFGVGKKPGRSVKNGNRQAKVSWESPLADDEGKVADQNCLSGSHI